MNLDVIIRKIKPTPAERKDEMKLVERIFDLLKDEPVHPMLVGSLAKDTDLAGNKDVDIFIQFKPDVSRAELEREGLRIGREVLGRLGVEHEMDYAEHPYVKGMLGNLNIEVVPCYDGGRIISAVDRTPHHTEYVKKKIATTTLNDEIRLLKQFMRGIRVYGAEAKVEGFSGYLVELLVIHYGSFIKTLEAARSWRIPQVIDVEGLWEDSRGLTGFFTHAGLVVVDPVDRNRNVAAAVSLGCLAGFIVKADEYVRKPGEEFFFPSEKPARSLGELKSALRRRGTKFIALVFRHGKINANTLYAQLRKTGKSIGAELKELEFQVFRDGFWTNEKDVSALLFEFEVWQLPELTHHTGPPVDQDPENQEKFTSKYGKDRPYVKDGRWVVDTKRRYRVASEPMPEIVRERRGFGKNLRELSEARILEDEAVFSIDDPGWVRFLNEYLD